MGTRNLTKVVLGGETVFNKYTQWDGFPTNVGAELMKFAKEVDVARLKTAFANTELIVTDINSPCFYTGAPLTDEYREPHKKVEDYQFAYWEKRSYRDSSLEYLSFSEIVKKMVTSGLLTGDEAEKVLVASRDTAGYELLRLVYERPLDKAPLILYTESAMIHEDGYYGCDIEGCYTLDLDSDHLCLNRLR